MRKLKLIGWRTGATILSAAMLMSSTGVMLNTSTKDAYAYSTSIQSIVSDATHYKGTDDSAYSTWTCTALGFDESSLDITEASGALKDSNNRYIVWSDGSIGATDIFTSIKLDAYLKLENPGNAGEYVFVKKTIDFFSTSFSSSIGGNAGPVANLNTITQSLVNTVKNQSDGHGADVTITGTYTQGAGSDTFTIVIPLVAYNKTNTTDVGYQGISLTYAGGSDYVGNLIDVTKVSATETYITKTWEDYFKNNATTGTRQNDITASVQAKLSAMGTEFLTLKAVGTNTFECTYTADESLGWSDTKSFDVTGLENTETSRVLQTITANLVDDTKRYYVGDNVEKADIQVIPTYDVTYINGTTNVVTGVALPANAWVFEDDAQPVVSEGENYIKVYPVSDNTKFDTITLNGINLLNSPITDVVVDYTGDPVKDGDAVNKEDIKVYPVHSDGNRSLTEDTSLPNDSFNIVPETVSYDDNTVTIKTGAISKDVTIPVSKVSNSLYVEGRNLWTEGEEITKDDFNVSKIVTTKNTDGTESKTYVPTLDYEFDKKYVGKDDTSITVTLADKSAMGIVAITVSNELTDKQLKGIEVKYTEDSITVGETPDKDKVEVTATYTGKNAAGNTVTVKEKADKEKVKFVPENPEPAKKGVNTYTVEYEGEKATVDITGVPGDGKLTRYEVKLKKPIYKGQPITKDDFEVHPIFSGEDGEIEGAEVTDFTIDKEGYVATDEPIVVTITTDDGTGTITVKGEEAKEKERKVSYIDVKYEGSDLGLGSKVEKDTIKVTPYYNITNTDGTEKKNVEGEALSSEDFTISPDVIKNIGENEVKVSFVYDEETTTATVVITGTEKTIVSKKEAGIIAVVTEKQRLIGDAISKADFKVYDCIEVTYSDGTTAKIADGVAYDEQHYTIDKDKCESAVTKVNVVSGKEQYEAEVTAQEAKLTVPTSLSAVYKGDNLNVGTKIDKDKIIVTPTYDLKKEDGSVIKKDVVGTVLKSVDFTISPETIVKTGTNTVTITYTKDGATVTTTVDIEGSKADDGSEKAIKSSIADGIIAFATEKTRYVGDELTTADFEVYDCVKVTYYDDTTARVKVPNSAKYDTKYYTIDKEKCEGKTTTVTIQSGKYSDKVEVEAKEKEGNGTISLKGKKNPNTGVADNTLIPAIFAWASAHGLAIFGFGEALHKAKKKKED